MIPISDYFTDAEFNQYLRYHTEAMITQDITHTDSPYKLILGYHAQTLDIERIAVMKADNILLEWNAENKSDTSKEITPMFHLPVTYLPYVDRNRFHWVNSESEDKYYDD